MSRTAKTCCTRASARVPHWAAMAGGAERPCRFGCELQLLHARGWILCRRLEWERGTVSGRVALLLRSAEVKPSLLKICSTYGFGLLSFLLIRTCFRGGRNRLLDAQVAGADKGGGAESEAYGRGPTPPGIGGGGCGRAKGGGGGGGARAEFFCGLRAAGGGPYELCLDVTDIHGHRTPKAPHPVRSAKLTGVPLS